MPVVPFTGAVLTGGASSRMGRDKALVTLETGRPLAFIAALALEGAGAVEVVVVGGDQAALETAGLRWIGDRYPGEGPLGGIITALSAASTDLVAVLACDMPGVGPSVPTALVAALAGEPTAGVAIAVVDARDQPLTAVWRRSVALAVLEAAFDAGERAPRRVLDHLLAVRVVDLAPEELEDVDSPGDLRRYAERHSPPNQKD